MARRRPHQVEVVTERKQSAIALLRGRRQRFLSAPGFDNDGLRQVGAQNLVPSHHDLVMPGEDLLQSLVEVRLQVPIAFQSVRTDESLDIRIVIPRLAVYFVSTDMEVG